MMSNLPAQEASATSAYRALVDSLANQLCPAVDGQFDFRVRVEADDPALKKLQVLINFVLDSARRSVQEGYLQQRKLASQVHERERAKAALQATLEMQMRLNDLQQQLLSRGALREKLSRITSTAIEIFGLDLCRIWVAQRGDLCGSGCVHARATAGPSVCRRREQCLHLVASSGRNKCVESEAHQRVPFDCYTIGRVAGGDEHKLLIDDITSDTRFHDPEWARELGLIAFAGYQLRPPGGETIGAMALFGQRAVSPEVDAHSEILANAAARVILSARLEEEQLALNEQLVQAQRLESVGQLAAGIAHEINTPTQFVSDNTRFLQSAIPKLTDVLERYGRLADACRSGTAPAALLDELDTAVKKAKLDYLLGQIPEALSDSLEGLERVTKIVRAMKDFSHPGQETMAPADLNRAIESTVTVARNEWKYVADMQLEFDPALPLVSCLVADINQVILNIVVNAAHAINDVVGDGGGKGTITISTRRDGDQAEIRIRDTGSGIPAAHRAKVFEQFFTTKAVGKGTGQGLAIARRVIVEKHGGEITFETETGQGTTFVIRLPIDADAEAATESLADVPACSAG